MWNASQRDSRGGINGHAVALLGKLWRVTSGKPAETFVFDHHHRLHQLHLLFYAFFNVTHGADAFPHARNSMARLQANLDLRLPADAEQEGASSGGSIGYKQHGMGREVGGAEVSDRHRR